MFNKIKRRSLKDYYQAKLTFELQKWPSDKKIAALNVYMTIHNMNVFQYMCCLIFLHLVYLTLIISYFIRKIEIGEKTIGYLTGIDPMNFRMFCSFFLIVSIVVGSLTFVNYLFAWNLMKLRLRKILYKENDASAILELLNKHDPQMARLLNSRLNPKFFNAWF